MGDTVLSESCPAGTLSHIKARQEYWCGYLNVKTLQLGPEKKSKDRSWHCYWAQVSDDQLLLYKVETMSTHANSSHPPTDKDCPPKHLMQEVDHISLVKAVVGLEYTYKAEAKNRRRYLFRITQENGADYLLQASSDGAAVCWSETLRTIAGRYADHMDEDFIREIAIKRMRDGDKKVGKAGKGAAINAPILSKTASPAPPLDPAVLQLKNVLQKKIDLLYHLRQMEKVFSNQLQPRTPSPEVAPQFYFTDDDNHAGCCSSPSEPSTGRNSSVFERREATMLKDYYLIAGAAWSLLNKGEKVIVLQELRSGYYLVKATRNTIIHLNKLETKRNISDNSLANQATPTGGGRYSEPTSPTNVDTATSTVSILIQSSDSNIVPSDSFQSTISDDSGIVESSKRASNLSNKEDEGTSETGGVHLENGNAEDGFETAFKAYSTASLPANIHISKDKNGKLSTPPASGRITNSVSFSTISEYSSKDHVSLPLIGSVPPSVLDCYVEQLFSPTLVRPHSSNMVLQPAPPSSKSPATKKKKSATKGNRLSLQVDNYSLEDQSPSTKQKSSTLPPNSSIASSPVGQKPEKGKRAFKNFFKKRLSTHGKLLSSISSEGDSDKEFLSVQEDSLPSDVDRMQSPVYEYTPITHSGQEFRRRGKSFVYTIGGSSSDSDSDDESETSDKSGSSHSRRKRVETSTPPSDKRSSIASNESSTREEVMFEISMDDSSPQQNPKGTGSDYDVKESPEHNAMHVEELVVPRKHTRTSLKKMKSLPTSISKDDTVDEEYDKQVHRLSAGEFPSIEISMRAPPLNKKRHVYLDAKVQKFGFRLETYGRISSSGDIADTVVYTVTQGSAAFLAGMYPGDVILEVEGVDVSEKNCKELGNIIASYKKTQQVICLTVKFIDGVRRLDLRRMEQKNQRKNSDRYSTASSEGDSSDNDDKRLSGPPFSPQTAGAGLGRISETTEEESIVEEETAEGLLPQAQVVSPSQA